MKRLFVLILLAGALLSCRNSGVNYPEALEQLHKNVVADILNGSSGSQTVDANLDGLKEEGSWPDIDYTSKERGGWPPAGHLSRTLELAKAYRNPESEYFRKKPVSEKIHKALNFWLDNDFICPNWWYPEIGVPKILSPVMILMEAELSDDQMKKGIKILNRSSIGMTGQNKVWQSGIVLLKSLLLRNEDTIRLAASAIQEELVQSTGEGVQPDWSYHQHGPQLQFGNYGLSYVTDMMKWIAILRNTPFHFDEDKVSVLRNYLLEGQQWVSWKGMYDISACGRQLFPGSQVSKAETLSQSLKKMVSVDSGFAQAYKSAGHWELLNGNRHFWRSDFQVQRTPDYYFSVKMCSNRVIGAESCNSENLQGYYMGDGATFLYLTQKEYQDIFPYWDWKKIPGTTVHQDDETLPVLTASGYRIESHFVGGVSDGTVGVAAMDYNRNGLKARKSWFIFGDMIVCLGAGISSSEGLPVTTGINQVFYNEEADALTTGGETGKENYRWICHNGVGYFFPVPNDIRLTTDMEKGSWAWVAGRYPEDVSYSRIFKLWQEHGINPSDASYEYVLVPNASAEKMKSLDSGLPFKIRNKKNQQEVISTDGKLACVVFYEPGKADIFDGVEVDNPCIMMLQKSGAEIQLSVSDPTQLLKEVNISLSGLYEGKDADSEKGTTRIKVVLPQGNDAGKSISYNIKKI